MIRLNVPFRQKDEAKQFGARWNPTEKYWYYPGDVLPEGLQRWSIPDTLPAGGDHRANAVSLQGAVGISAPDDVEGPWQRGSFEESDLQGDVEGPWQRGSFEGPDPQGAVEGLGHASEMAADWLKNYQTVSDVNQMILRCYGDIREFRNIMVWGEVTNYRNPNGGNYYFDIKDGSAMLSCIMWGSVAAASGEFTLKAGMKVAIVGYLDYYPVTGKTSLKVRKIKDAGQGAAALALLRLHARLEAEGLFDERFKKPIPRYPSVIGIVTSKDGQAIQDICKVAKMRNPYVQLLLFHVKVQGQYAVNTIIQGIQTLDGMGLDTIIVGRGGGSDEELMCYNDERVVRAIFMAKTPIISAVGHEGNWSLSDYVADLRVLTPTAAGQAALPDVMTDLEHIRQLQIMITNQMHSHLQRRWLMLDAARNKLEGFGPQIQIERRKERLQYLTAAMQTGFMAALDNRKRSLELLSQDLRRKMESAFELRRHRCEVLITRLHGLSPTAKLVKGFGYISLNEKPVTTIQDVQEGDPLLIRIHDGRIRAQVTETQRN